MNSSAHGWHSWASLSLAARSISSQWPDKHHIVHWARGGTTDLDNLVLLCHRHHWMVHEGGWQLMKRDDGTVLTLPPTADFNPWLRVAPANPPPEPQLISSA